MRRFLALIVFACPLAAQAAGLAAGDYRREACEQYRLGDYDRAMSLLRQGLSLVGPDLDMRCRILTCQADVYRKQGQYVPAARTLEEAVRATRRLKGQDSPYVIPLLDNLADVAALAREAPTALGALQESLRLRQLCLGDNSPGLLVPLEKIHGQLVYTAADVPYARKIYDMRRASGDLKKSERSSEICSQLAVALVCAGKAAEAENYARQALDLATTQSPVRKLHAMVLLAIVLDKTKARESQELLAAAYKDAAALLPDEESVEAVFSFAALLSDFKVKAAAARFFELACLRDGGSVVPPPVRIRLLQGACLSSLSVGATDRAGFFFGRFLASLSAPGACTELEKRTVLFQTSSLLTRAKAPALAAVCLERAIAASDMNAMKIGPRIGLQKRLGDLYTQAGDPVRAGQCYKKAEELGTSKSKGSE